MEVKFDLVRIGKIRKDSGAEIILKQNIDLLRESIRYFLKEEKYPNKNNRVEMTMIVPGKGFNIKIALQDVGDFYLRKKLREKFPNSIYKGKYSTIIENIHNRVFR